MWPIDIIDRASTSVLGESTNGKSGFADQLIVFTLASILLWHFIGSIAFFPITTILLCSFRPAGKRAYLGIGALGVAAHLLWSRRGIDLDISLVIVGVAVCASYLVYYACQRKDNGPLLVRKYPGLTLHACCWCLLGALTSISQVSNAAFPVVLLPLIVDLTWRCTYMIRDAQHKDFKVTSFVDHLFYLVPIYVGGRIPIGKAWSYLQKTEAKETGALFVCQQSGLRLLVTATLLRLGLQLFEVIINGSVAEGNPFGLLVSLGVGWPSFSEVLQRPSSVPIGVRWALLYSELFRMSATVAIHGHVSVAILRLLGFGVTRATDKPLFARSLVQFWNRYQVYFKELLADLFFYPVYFRARRCGPRLRLFCAVASATFIGNMYFHLLIAMTEAPAASTWSSIVDTMCSRAVYCATLTTGLFVSMNRQLVSVQQYGHRAIEKICDVMVVWTFFSVVHIWSYWDGAVSFAQRNRFCLSLIGLT